MEILVREAEDRDIEDIIKLFCEAGSNPYGWNVEKWKYYYRYYSEGKPISLIATVNGTIVGHYGLQPIRIAELPAMLGLHAYIASNQRGLTILSALMKEVDRVAKSQGIKLICGFANQRFSQVKSTIFKWKTLCWLGFQTGVSEEDYILKQNKKYFFHYSDAWYTWRFGSKKDNYVSVYYDNEKNTHIQLLKTSSNEHHIESQNIELWSPRTTFATNQAERFCQPFSVKVYEPSLVAEGILDLRNWNIDMGDSDTFKYIPEERYT